MSTPSPFRSDVLGGKVALITGGGSGIGYEIARQLGLHGASLVISGRRKEVIAESAASLQQEGIKCMPVSGDVRSLEDAEKMVATATSTYGRLDILVNCAAGNFLAVAEELKPKGFKTVMDIDALGVFTTSHAAFPALKASGAAVIINISATLHYGATWYQTHASAAKAAIDSMTRSLALEWGAHGIRVAGVAPGPIAGTAGLTKLAPGAEQKMSDKMKAEIPVGYLGEKWDIAMACVYLSCSAGRFVSGDTLVVDGAQWMWRPPMAPRELVSKLSRGVEKTSRAVGLAPGGNPRSKL